MASERLIAGRACSGHSAGAAAVFGPVVEPGVVTVRSRGG
jgi:hypothetical protein